MRVRQIAQSASRLPSRLVEKFRILRPTKTHWRGARCSEVDCPHYLNGWASVVPPESPSAKYIRHYSERRFEEKTEAGLTTFAFYAGQECFREHRLPLERSPLFVREHSGDRRVQEVNQFIDGMNDHVEKITR